MCRLLGFVARPPATLHDVLGDGYDAFLSLARDPHADGWGLAWPEGDRVVVAKEATGAAGSPAFAAAAADRSSDALLVHFRWATMNLAVAEANTHPFGDGALAFAHNGSIFEMPAIEVLTGGPSPTPLGTTDSERYWFAVQAAVARSGDAVRGLAEAVLTVAGHCRYSSINCLLLTPDQLIAVCWYDPDRLPDGVPADYYDLAYRADDRGVVVASSGWPRPGWTTLPNGSLLVMDRQRATADVIDVRAAAGAPAAGAR